MRLLACLIVAPRQGYDEPGCLSYKIRPFCPTSADGLQLPTLQSAAEISDVPLAPPKIRPRSSLEQPTAPLGTFIADRVNKSRCPRRLRDKNAWASASAIVKLPLVGLVD